MTKLTEAVLNNEVQKKAKIHTDDELQQFLKRVKRNFKVFTKLFKTCNSTADDSFDQLSSIKNDLTLFTYQPVNVCQYKMNTIGECVMTKIANGLEGECFINDLKK